MIEKVIGGLQWAEDGKPNFLCLLVERKRPEPEQPGAAFFK